MTPTEILQAIHDSEINFRIDCQYDSVWSWTLHGRAGALAGGLANNLLQLSQALADAAVRYFPDSDFGRLYFKHRTIKSAVERMFEV